MSICDPLSLKQIKTPQTLLIKGPPAAFLAFKPQVMQTINGRSTVLKGSSAFVCFVTLQSLELAIVI